MEQRGVQAGVLLGSDHTTYGVAGSLTMGGGTSIALSIGTHPKGYPGVDSNEDAVLAATAGGSTLMAVADGHNGFDAARAAISTVQSLAEEVLGDGRSDPVDALTDVARRANASIHAALQGVTGVRRQSRTTLVLALVRGPSAAVLGHGDSTSVVVRRHRVKALTRHTSFLDGGDMPPGTPARISLRRGDALILGSDGLFDFLGQMAHRSIRDAVGGGPPPAIALGLIERAGAGGAGDNVAVAVHVHGFADSAGH